MFSSFVEKVMALWGPLAGFDADEAADFPRFDAPDPLPKPATEELNDQVLNLAGPDGGAIHAGALMLIGLGPVRSALGERWPALSARIVGITHEMLAQMLPPPDLFVQHDSDNVLLCFASPNREVAEHRTAMIARAVQTELERQMEELAGRISVEHIVSKVPQSDLDPKRTDLVADLLRTLQQLREDARRHGSASSWIRSAQLLFQPLWDVEHERTGPNRCLIDIAGAGATLAQLEALGDSESAARAVARLDFLTFARAVETVRTGPLDYRQAPLLVPLHFETLSRRVWLADYLKMCSLVPDACRDFLQLEILGLPEDVSSAELASHVEQLGTFTPCVVVQISLRTPLLHILPKAGLYGLSFNFGELGRLPNLREPLRALARRARAEGLASFAIGANTIGQARAAQEAGFAFIGGAAIHATVGEPKAATRFVPLPQRRASYWPAHVPTGAPTRT